MEKVVATDALLAIMPRCHIIAVQEVRDASGTAVPALLTAINAKQSNDQQYSVVESARFGSSSSKEAYAWFYRTDLIFPMKDSAKDWSAALHADGTSLLFPERSPHAVTWQVDVDGYSPIQFEAIVMHIDPDAVIEE